MLFSITATMTPPNAMMNTSASWKAVSIPTKTTATSNTLPMKPGSDRFSSGVVMDRPLRLVLSLWGALASRTILVSRLSGAPEKGYDGEQRKGAKMAKFLIQLHRPRRQASHAGRPDGAGLRRANRHRGDVAGCDGHVGPLTPMSGIISRILVWLGFVVTTNAVNNAFQKRKTMLTVIDSGHWLVVLIVSGAVIGLFG
ncbi:MAG: DUF1761 domain-containing protein [Alphaproteobacteria bacterium]|nr:DUF1761 domain-containing protein [Alphaproteobacteria bacterium]